MWLAAKISSATAICPSVMMSENQRPAVILFCSVDIRLSPCLREWGTSKHISRTGAAERWKFRSCDVSTLLLSCVVDNVDVLPAYTARTSCSIGRTPDLCGTDQR